MKLGLFMLSSAIGWQMTACAAAAPTAYGTELLDCVRTSSTRDEADACRARVDARYGQTDAGRE